MIAIEAADGAREQHVDQLEVSRALVNGSTQSDLALSAQAGGCVALRLLSREYGRRTSLARLAVETEVLPSDVFGRSCELLFGILTFLQIAGLEGFTAGARIPRFAATGTLDKFGNVGGVEDVSEKIGAALASGLGSNGFVFYPRANTANIGDDLRRRCRDDGIHLRPVDRLDEALRDLGVAVQGWWPGSPFRALELFDREHHRIFFGRQPEVSALCAKLMQREKAGRPGALIVGASGSGKSSFCLAGMLPALEASLSGLETAVWRPREAIAFSHASDIGETAVAGSILAAWRRSGRNQTGFSSAALVSDDTLLADLPAALAPADSGTATRVWIVDQFEELFTLDFTESARRAFGRALQDLQARGVWIIGTLRNEFYGRYQEMEDTRGAPVLVDVFGPEGLFDLPRMGREALRQVIVRPAELAGLRFETKSESGIGLDETLLADALRSDDALPLLEFALQELYERLEAPGALPTDGEQRRLSFAAYDAIGGLQGAIGAMAHAAFSKADGDARQALPQLLGALAIPSDDDRRETARPASLGQWGRDAPIHRLIEALVKVRVIVRDDQNIRIAHEALLTHWEDAVRTLRASRRQRMQILELAGRARKWREGGRPEEWLLSQRDVNEAESVRGIMAADDSYAEVLEFLDESAGQQARLLRAHNERRERALRSARRRSVAFAALSAVLAIALVIAGVRTAEALESRKTAKLETAKARIAAFRADAAFAEVRTANESLQAQQIFTLRQRNRAVAAGLAEAEQRRAAEAATELTQEALDRTVARLTSVEFQEDAEFDKIQQAVLDQLNPIYQRQLNGAGRSPETALGYADMIDRTARLRASNQSIDAALANYQTAWEVIERSGLANAPSPVLDTFAENRAALYLAIGDAEAAENALRVRPKPAVVPLSRDCTQFRIKFLSGGYAGIDLTAADRLLPAAIAWRPEDATSSLYRMACLADLADVYLYYNETELALKAFEALDAAASGAAQAHPRSVSFRAMRVRAALTEALLDPSLAAGEAGQSTGTPAADGVKAASRARADAAMARAESLVEQMAQLAPESRLLLDTRLQVRLARRRSAFREATSDAAEQIKFASNTDWIDDFEDLIQREPGSPALERRLRDSIQASLSGIATGGGGPGALGPPCRALLPRLMKVFQRLPDSRVVAEGVLAAAPCTAALAAQADGTQPPSDLVRQYAAARERAALIRINTFSASSPGRLASLRTAFEALASAGKTDPEASRRLLALASAQAAADRDSIRFSRMAAGAIGQIVDRATEAKDFAAARAALRACPAFSAPQRSYCRLYQRQVLQDLAGFPGAPPRGARDGTDREILYLDARMNATEEAWEAARYDVATPLVIVERMNGKLVFLDDISTSARFGAAAESIAAYRTNLRIWREKIPLGLKAGLPFRDAVNLAGLAGWRLAGPPEARRQEDWGKSPAGIAYLQKVNRLATEFYPKPATPATPPPANGASPPAPPPPSSPLDAKTTWRTSASSTSTKPVVLDEALLKEKVIVLMQGGNVYADPIFTYLELTLERLQALREKLRKTQDFMPSEYGTVLAAGRGAPSRAMRAEMAQKYDMVDVPGPAR